MNVTQTLRNYLLDNKGTIFDVNYEHAKHFGMFDKRTMIRVLMRLDKDEHIISWVDKGVYYVNDGSECTEEKIVSHYTEEGRGMLLGGALFKELGIVSKYDGPIEVLTNKSVANKTIGNIKIIKSDSLLIDYKMIALLEILEKCNMPDDMMKVARLVDKYLDYYLDMAFDLVIPHMTYKTYTIYKLANLLDNKGKVNHCIESFKKYHE